MFDKKQLDDLIKRLSDAVPSGLKNMQKEIEKNFRVIIESTFHKLDLVTRKEFDAQIRVLIRTREKLEELEKKLKDLQTKSGKKDKEKE